MRITVSSPATDRQNIDEKENDYEQRTCKDL